jgi:glycosyltransferase involved in cell wall biosynthesis
MQPLVSCIMPTADRRAFAAQAIRYFQEQDYPNKELLIFDDGSESLADLVPRDPAISYLRLDHKLALGAKRNLACTEARGEIIVHWDDDDWMAGWRLTYQVDALLKEQADLCGLDNLLFYDPARDEGWQYVYDLGKKFWVAGATLCYRKSFWRQNPFPNINIGEDTRFVWASRSTKMLALKDNRFYVAMIHPGNTSPKQTADRRYQSYPASEVKKLLEAERSFYAGWDTKGGWQL